MLGTRRANTRAATGGPTLGPPRVFVHATPQLDSPELLRGTNSTALSKRGVWRRRPRCSWGMKAASPRCPANGQGRGLSRERSVATGNATSAARLSERHPGRPAENPETGFPAPSRKRLRARAAAPTEHVRAAARMLGRGPVRFLLREPRCLLAQPELSVAGPPPSARAALSCSPSLPGPPSLVAPAVRLSGAPSSRHEREAASVVSASVAAAVAAGAAPAGGGTGPASGRRFLPARPGARQLLRGGKKERRVQGGRGRGAPGCPGGGERRAGGRSRGWGGPGAPAGGGSAVAAAAASGWPAGCGPARASGCVRCSRNRG
ncbi:hypothetical protein J0S82_015276 [Galemys pyrenaicus]|uniref:Uncharacterized protein n=1 Tax=Galemys pyrenaicus TaxID=202257 RepID=A0A8J6AUM1_GALPY|nr:hypothetical protein J0S82_015276 [Galemys pyrenaicus]